MKNNNKYFFITLIFLFIVFTSISVLSYLKKSNVNDIINANNSTRAKLVALEDKLALHKSLESDLKIAEGEHKKLIDSFRKQKNFRSDILSDNTNIYLNHKEKSAPSINANLVRLYTTLSSRCENNHIKLNNAQDAPMAPQQNAAKHTAECGFGFTSYNGFWPSFSLEEANKIDIQGKIIKEIVDKLAGSTVDGQSISLKYIRRESVGSIDQKHIGTDEVSKPNPKLLLRQKGLIDTLFFEVSFSGRTENARSFMNQLRSPFSVRKFTANRSTQENEATNSFLGSSKISSTDEILPIIRNIESTFIFSIEYICKIYLDTDDFTKKLKSRNSEDDRFIGFLNNFSSNL